MFYYYKINIIYNKGFSLYASIVKEFRAQQDIIIFISLRSFKYRPAENSAN